MKYLFEDKEIRLKLRRELDSWVGTPFRHGAGVKGYGADCIHHVVCVLQNVGAISKKIKIPNYPKDWHLHRSRELIVEGIVNQLNVENVGFDDPMDGDIILYQFGRCAAHSSIYYGGYGYHSITGQKNCRLHYSHEFKHGKKKYGFRLLGG